MMRRFSLGAILAATGLVSPSVVAAASAAELGGVMPKRPNVPRGRLVRQYRVNHGIPAYINRHTMAPHEHRKEIARRTTKPGTPERRAAIAAAKAGRG